MSSEPYNPLEKINLAQSIERELLARPARPLSEVDAIVGAGIYVIYYSGSFEAYRRIRANAEDRDFDAPIYVGKAIPKGGRKGGLGKDAGSGAALRDRLRQHAGSVDEAHNLELDHFWVRHLVVDDIWIPLGENMLIERFKPLWNRAIDGFGNKVRDGGARRSTARHGMCCIRVERSPKSWPMAGSPPIFSRSALTITFREGRSTNCRGSLANRWMRRSCQRRKQPTMLRFRRGFRELADPDGDKEARLLQAKRSRIPF